MTINGNNYCSPVVKTLRTQANIPLQPTDIAYATIYGCEYSLSTNNLGASVYQYEWAVNSNFSTYEITTINTTTALPGLELEPCISTPVYVRARNSCSIGEHYSENITFPSLPCCQMTGCCGYGDQMNGGDKEFSVVYYRETNQIHIEYIGEQEFTTANIFVMSSQGRVSEKYQMNERTIDLPDNCIVNGMNLINIDHGYKIHSFKLIK
ncbi:MAG TPA: hypothetical protein PLP88_09380 [Bacteroidales bacterium]|nr:hypothetical protein [Bacteroidales bacterium]